ncbi:MAG: hypothetical protein ACI9FR_001042 [Cryomorphaceae bacterium]|jgi:hypothetical protein
MLGFSSRAVLALSILICVSSAYGDNKHVANPVILPVILPLLFDDDDNDDTPLPTTEDLSDLYGCFIADESTAGFNGLIVSSNLGALPDNTGTRGPFRVSVSATCIDNTFVGVFDERAALSDTYDFPTTFGNPTGRLTGAQSEFGSFRGSQPFSYIEEQDNIFGADFCDIDSFFTDITVTLTPLTSPSGIPQLVGSVTCEGRFGDG